MAFSFSRMISNDIGIDLGTANTLVYVRSQGIVINEPSIVALDRSTRRPLAIGSEAKEMIGRTPDEIEAIRPLRDGVICDFEITEEMLRFFIRRTEQNRLFVRPRIVISVPSGITEVEKRAVRDSAERAGAREVYLSAEPMAAAIGIGLPVDEPVGNMVIDLGGGTTEIAVIALSGIVRNKSIKVAGDEMDEAIVQFLRKEYNLAIGPRMAEQIKCQVGSAVPMEEEFQVTVKGLDLVKAIPKTITVDSEEIREALSGPVDAIVDATLQSLEQTPPELAADIIDRGIVMTGGGALLRGLDRKLMEETNLPVSVAEDPLRCVVKGTGKILEDIGRYNKMLF